MTPDRRKFTPKRLRWSCIFRTFHSERLRRPAKGYPSLFLVSRSREVMNGYDATRPIRVQEQGTGRHIPIVALTAHAMKGDREICLKAGMDDYLGKPIHSSELFAVLQRWGKDGDREGRLGQIAGQVNEAAPVRLGG